MRILSIVTNGTQWTLRAYYGRVDKYLVLGLWHDQLLFSLLASRFKRSHSAYEPPEPGGFALFSYWARALVEVLEEDSRLGS